jgi:hypothetical protein
MAQVKVTVTDDDGKTIGIHEYDLAKGLHTLSKMESAIEELRPQMLSDINRDLLDEEQRAFQKKRALRGVAAMQSKSRR